MAARWDNGIPKPTETTGLERVWVALALAVVVWLIWAALGAA